MAKDMSGSLKKNAKKESDKHPDYKGRITINGQLYWLSSWINTDRETGEKYMSLSAQKAEPRQDSERAPFSVPAPAKSLEEMDDDLPF